MRVENLTQIQQEILFGILLGDANLSAEAEVPTTYRLRVLQSLEHKDYLFHLYEIFKDMTTTGPIYYETPPDNRTGKIYKQYFFNTVQQRCLFEFAQLFYDSKTSKKGIPNNEILNKFLLPRALAYWFMDDGSLKMEGVKAVRISTDSFAKAEVERLCSFLKNKYDIAATVQKKSQTAWHVYIGTKTYPRFKELVNEYIVPSMRYKLPELD